MFENKETTQMGKDNRSSVFKSRNALKRSACARKVLWWAIFSEVFFFGEFPPA